MTDKKPKKWIKAAINPEHKGELRAKAQKAGMSTGAYAQVHEHDSGKTGGQARLAETLMGMHKAGKHHVSSKKMMHSLYGKGKE